MKAIDNFYNRTLKNNPNKKLTPIIIIGNIYGIGEKGMRIDQSASDTLLCRDYSDFDYNKLFILSPHAMRLSFYYGDNIDDNGQRIIDRIETIPALKKEPKIQESINFRTKRIKVSTLKIDLHDLKIRDKTLSDMIGAYDSEGKEVRLAWVDSDVHDPIDIRHSFINNVYDGFDITHTPVNYTQIFVGALNTINETEASIALTVEDASFKLFNRDIPIARLPDTEEIQERYRLQPIPMVYGNLEKAPLVLSDTNLDDDEFYLLADDTFNDERTFNITCNPYSVFLGNEKQTYYEIPRDSTILVYKYESEGNYSTYEYNDAIQVITDNGTSGNPGNYLIIGSEHYDDNDVSPNPYSDGFLHVSLDRKSKKVVLVNGSENGTTDSGLDYRIIYKGSGYGFDIYNRVNAYDGNRNTFASLPNFTGGDYFTVQSVEDVNLIGPGLGIEDAADLDDGFATGFLNDGSKRNQHQDAMQDEVRSVASGEGNFGILQGDGLMLFGALLEQNPSIIENNDELNSLWEDGRQTLFDGSEIPLDNYINQSNLTDIKLEDLLSNGGYYPGKGGLGFWGIDKDAIMELSDDENGTPEKLMSNLLNDLYPQYCGGDNTKPYLMQHFLNAQTTGGIGFGGNTYHDGYGFMWDTPKNALLLKDLAHKTWFKEYYESIHGLPSNAPDTYGSVIEALADKLGISQNIYEFTPLEENEDTGNTDALARLIGSLLLHPQGIIGGIQGVWFDNDYHQQMEGYSGLGQCKQIIFPFTMTLGHDHFGNAFGTSELKYFRTPEQLTEAEINEGWTSQTVGNTLLHWLLSVSPFIGSVEGILPNNDEEGNEEATIFESNFDANNGAFVAGTYIQDNRVEKLQYKRATFWNNIPFTFSDGYANSPGWNTYGDLNYWSPNSATIYFVQPTLKNPHWNLYPSSMTSYFEAFEPYSVDPYFYNLVFWDFDPEQHGSGEWYAPSVNTSIYQSGSSGDGNMGVIISIGKLSGLFLENGPTAAFESQENEGGQILTEYNEDWERVDYYVIRTDYTFDSIADKDIIATGTTLDTKLFFSLQSMAGSLSDTGDDFMEAQIGVGDEGFFQLAKCNINSEQFAEDDTLMFNFDTETPSNNGFSVSGATIDDEEGFLNDNVESTIIEPSVNYGTGYYFGSEDGLRKWDEPNAFSSFNFTFFMFYGGRFKIFQSHIHNKPYEMGVHHECLIANVNTKDYFADVQGRIDSTYIDGPIRSAVDVINHIIISELGVDPNLLDMNNTNNIRIKSSLYGGGIWALDFALTEIRSGKTYLEHLNKASNFTTRIGSNNRIRHVLLPDHLDINFFATTQNTSSNPINRTIESKDVIKYKWKTTPKSNLITRINIKFGFDHLLKKTSKETGYLAIDDVMVDKYDYEYDFNMYNLERVSSTGALHPTTTREFTFNEVSDIGVARRIRKFILLQNCNTKLTGDITLTLDYAYLEVGDIIVFNELIRDLKPFNKDYTRFEIKNGQLIYPYFMITKIKKTTKDIKITIERMVRLDYGPPVTPTHIEGKTPDEMLLLEEANVILDRGTGFTRGGAEKNAHNPFLVDESLLPAANPNDNLDDWDTPTSWRYPLLGNTNGDLNVVTDLDIINVLDVVLLVNVVLGNITPAQVLDNAIQAPANNIWFSWPDVLLNENTVMKPFDLNEDGITNILDIVMIVQIILND